MGKSVPRGVKVKAEILLKERNDFSRDFEKNKEIINSMDLELSKKIRNLVAGYITRRMGSEEQ
ncbi:30S ribosomal protein S17e [Candidatus Micrarchaeota archaeon]|nr:30S ribosomal protein S17e [Candidatus Micrarchaeota archaeon]MBU2476157.1 30S ribosomal protein S17e [Candidatus Micrarchaeota archaeon]